MKQLPKDLKGKTKFVVGSWVVWAFHLHIATRVGYHLSALNEKRIRKTGQPIGRCGSAQVNNKRFYWARETALQDPDLYSAISSTFKKSK